MKTGLLGPFNADIEVGHYMAMDKIHGSPLLRHGAVDNFRKTKEATSEASSKETDRLSSQGSEAQGKQIFGDQAIISPAGKQLVELRQAVDTGRAALASLPDVREEKVTEVRDKLQKGFYNSQVVHDKVASRLADVFLGMEQTST